MPLRQWTNNRITVPDEVVAADYKEKDGVYDGEGYIMPAIQGIL